MLGLGYRKNSLVIVALCDGARPELQEAIQKRLKRIKDKKDREKVKSKPFYHIYTVRSKEIVISVFNEGTITKENVRTAIDLVFDHLTRERLTVDALARILRQFTPYHYNRDKIVQTRKDIEIVKSTMRDNIKKALLRDDNIQDLEAQTEQLTNVEETFIKTTDLRIEKEREACKIKCILYTLLILGCLLIIGGSIFGVIKYIRR